MGYYSAEFLQSLGFELPIPSAVYVEDSVPKESLKGRGSVLHPGTRISGPETILDASVQVGAEGPAVLENVALGEGASFASGYAKNATLFSKAALGANSHVRAGTILEEEASTAHCVGLKQTILLSFATLGSLINFCDCLLAGGRSRKDHSEVGSGFIHFNFTPFGPHGDKATPSLFGQVEDGVFLDQKRIFLGGNAGAVGPLRLGFGAVLAAGSVFRKDYGDGLLAYGEKNVSKSAEFDGYIIRGIDKKTTRSIEYMGQLRALSYWYREVRMARAKTEFEQMIIQHGLRRLAEGLAERRKQLERFLDTACVQEDPQLSATAQDCQMRWQAASLQLLEEGEAVPKSLLDAIAEEQDLAHPQWVQGIGKLARSEAGHWMRKLALVAE